MDIDTPGTDDPPEIPPCEHCVFFDRPPMGFKPPPGVSETERVALQHAGRCRGNAPALTTESPTFVFWPITMTYLSCGGGKFLADITEAPVPCTECRFFYRPPLGITPPATANEAVRQNYQGAGFCLRHQAGPSTKDMERPRPQMVRSTDWCGEGRRGQQFREVVAVARL